MSDLNDDVRYDDVYSAVQSLLDSGTTLANIKLRRIRKALNDRGSLTTISKHFKEVKSTLERGGAREAVDLSETDVNALCTVVRDIVERRTFLDRKEKQESTQAMSDLVRVHEADQAMNEEIIDDFEHQVLALEGDNEAKTREIEGLNAQVARLMGMVEALNAIIVTLAPKREAVATPASTGADQAPISQTHASTTGQVKMPIDITTNTAEDDVDYGG